MWNGWVHYPDREGGKGGTQQTVCAQRTTSNIKIVWFCSGVLMYLSCVRKSRPGRRVCEVLTGFPFRTPLVIWFLGQSESNVTVLSWEDSWLHCCLLVECYFIFEIFGGINVNFFNSLFTAICSLLVNLFWVTILKITGCTLKKYSSEGNLIR